MPLLGYGVFLVPPQEAEQCVTDALEVGYRLIDTAQAYNNEEGVGVAIAKSNVKRDDIFLVTKVWIANAGEEKAARSIDESLRKLQTDYIDLLLIHQAYGDVFGSWRTMEKAYKAGKDSISIRSNNPFSDAAPLLMRFITVCYETSMALVTFSFGSVFGIVMVRMPSSTLAEILSFTTSSGSM